MPAKRLTFEFSRGWLDHYKQKPYNQDETSADWKDGWMGRENYIRTLRERLKGNGDAYLFRQG